MAQFGFDGRTAVVTGAGRGLGRAYALLLAERGANVVVNDNGGSIEGQGTDASPAEQVVAEIKAAGGRAVACTESVAMPGGGRAIIEAALDSFGGIDILIHNAGNVRWGTLKEISDEDFDAVLDVHLLGGFHVVRAAFPRMCGAGYGRIVLTSSIGGLYGYNGVVNYGISKAGLLGLNKVIAIEGESEGVRCNALLPGAMTRMAAGMDTSTYPEAMMQPHIVAPLVGYLSSEACTASGEVFVSMAGRVARVVTSETVGMFDPGWTIEKIADNFGRISDPADTVTFSSIHGFDEHLGYSFDMANRGLAERQD